MATKTDGIVNINLDQAYSYPMRIVVVGDTHLTSRQPEFEPGLLDYLRSCAPDVIFHTGDICTLAALDQLKNIAPVYAVLGNRDIGLWKELPKQIDFMFDGMKISLLHGHGALPTYLYIKLIVFFSGPNNDRIIRLMPKKVRQSDVVIFGHSHIRKLTLKNGQAMLNPGQSYETYKDHRINPATCIIIDLFREDRITFMLSAKKNNKWYIISAETVNRSYFERKE